jgi:hypothetical protein
MSKIKTKGIHKHISYTVSELTSILGVNEKTVARWMESGLKTVSGGAKPYLIYGADLQAFLKTKDEKRKATLKRNEFYCFGCKRPRRAKRGSKKVVGDKEKATCAVCSGKMSRTIKPSQKYYQKSLFEM